MPSIERPRRFGYWLFAAVGLVGCGREPSSADAADADPVEFAIPAVPARAPVETQRLGSNIFDNICRIGNPFAVVGWAVNEETRFLYFAGPFNGAGDGLVHPYLYMAIPSPGRERMTTTLYLDELDEPELRKYAKPDELRRFRLPHIVGLPQDAKDARRQLGEPTHQRELESGRQRLIFERDLCLNDKRLVGVYLDVEDGRVVSAKGVDHPDRLKWIVSAGRPPQPDQRPTYYQDWEPREGTAQAAALSFVYGFEGRDVDGARARLMQPDLPSHPLDDFAKVFVDGSRIDSTTLTYQTTRHGIDIAEVAIAFALLDGRSFRETLELRDTGDKHWLVSGWRHDPMQGQLPD